MQYARETWLEERSSWRAIIQLNLIRAIVALLDLIGDALAITSPFDMSPPPLNEKHRLLRLHLAPLRNVQQDLQRRLGAAAVEESSNPGSGAVLPRPPEIATRSRDGWRTALERFRIRPRDAQEDARVRKAAEVTEVVAGCAEDMKTPLGRPCCAGVVEAEEDSHVRGTGLVCQHPGLLPSFPPLHHCSGFRFTDSKTLLIVIGQLLE